MCPGKDVRASVLEGHSLTAHRWRGRIGPGALGWWSGGCSAGVEEAAPQVLVDVVLADTERATDTYGGELTVVHQSVDGHLGDAHDGRHLGNGQELHVGD